MIKILSREALRQTVAKEPNKYKAIVIHEYGHPEDVSDIVRNCKEAIELGMDDITSDRLGGPTKQQVIDTLAKAKDYELVACRQGISRSSAFAYLIECERTSPKEAIKILDHKIHYPNELILKHALDVWESENKPYVKDFKDLTVDFYQRMADHRGWKRHPHNLVTKYFK